jgi:SSS family solute:Na+ symporter
MQLESIDWAIIVAFFVVTLSIGAIVSKRAGKSSSEFFLSGRNMPWWLLGFSMVATTFSADTPLLVTGLVRGEGVAGNWRWWAFLLTGMLTVFVYARLWRRSAVLTDIEFYELRYSGKIASFLRGFRAIYLGVFFNVIIMAVVTLAAIKISAIMLGMHPLATIVVASVVVVIFSAMGGLRGVLITDCILFFVAMIGAIGAAYFAVTHAQVGGLAALFAHPALQDKMSILPRFDFSTPESTNLVVTVLVVPLAVQWWSTWYPGAEPGGGGYIAQRMLAAKDEKNATGATLLFNVAHYALRPWPWIVVALASLVVYPDLASLHEAFPDVPASKLNNDLAYPAMLTFLPAGLRGLVIASLIAAYMSTISTHLNWGSSYVVNDFWKRFLRPEASEKEQVRVGRISTAVMMLLAGGLALGLKDAVQGFDILLQIGAGTGALFILRWFWWRINPYSELTAMIVSFLVALAFFAHGTLGDYLSTQQLTQPALVDSGWNETVAGMLVYRFETWQQIVFGVAITTVCWLLVTYMTRPDDDETLFRFCQLIRPGGPGWRKVMDRAAAAGVPLDNPPSGLPTGIACMVAGCVGVYSALFATGYWLYGQSIPAALLTLLALVAALFVYAMWNRVHAA